jgi:ankyrin repeat protein
MDDSQIASPETVALLLSYFPPSTSSQPNAPNQNAKQTFLDAPNSYGNTGLHWAALGGHLPVVKLLVEHGASVALANDKNYVPLDLASFGDKFDVVDYFLAQTQGGGIEGEDGLGNGGEDGDGDEEGGDEEGEGGRVGGLSEAVKGVRLDDGVAGEGEEGRGKGKGKAVEGGSS